MDKFDWYEFQKKQASESKVPWLREFYETPLPEVGTSIKDTPLLALDFETTGLMQRKTRSSQSVLCRLTLIVCILDKVRVG
ncbi:hypothetical protein JCM19231_4473 [Vibrio ishigakensis]|uniref:DNA-directed DNA polymerase n=1 Tax=Vibrio ishigakensis TaxID=1481914 RepID=A0A0B8NQU9_9VIBR|nr:hypothetical protein JCM19231_4473 [Vibrio ishigakensis]